MIKRILYAIPALIILFSVVYIHGVYSQIVVAAIAVFCMYEILRALSVIAQPVYAVGYAFAALIYPVFAYAGGFAGIALLLASAAMILITLPMLTGRNVKDSVITALALFYPGLFFVFMFSFMIAPSENNSRFLIIIAFGVAVVTDTFAYLTGRFFGKRKLMPAVSPKKTVEGAIGGLVFGAGFVTAAGILLQSEFDVNIFPLWYVALGIVLGVLTQIGDLTASYIKRRLCIKDFGHIMGEHGGALDRLDSVLFICPVIYAFYLLISV